LNEYVLDTHAFIWWAERPQRLGRQARRALARVDAGGARAWVPAILAVELALLREAGRRVPGAAEIEAATRRNPEVRVLPLDLAQCTEFSLLLALDDPFDRLIVAAARATRRPLISADDAIQESGLVDVIWE
jgi:PIN domain nuclease of toxin-antitoxin system